MTLNMPQKTQTYILTCEYNDWHSLDIDLASTRCVSVYTVYLEIICDQNLYWSVIFSNMGMLLRCIYISLIDKIGDTCTCRFWTNVLTVFKHTYIM